MVLHVHYNNYCGAGRIAVHSGTPSHLPICSPGIVNSPVCRIVNISAVSPIVVCPCLCHM